VPHKIVIPDADKFEHDADEAWRRGPREALRELEAASSLDAGGVVAISVTGMVPSLCAVDAEGVPRTPGLIYGDVRGRTGSGADPSASGETGAFLRWTAQEMPDAFGYWPAQAVANYALSGEPSLDTATAFSAYPLFDGNVWDEAALAEVGARPDQFPAVHVNGEAVGKVGDAVLGASSIDAMGEQLVAGADRDGDVMVILGTTLIIWVLDTGWREVPGLWTIPHLGGLENRSFIGGASNAGGLFLNWALRMTEPTSEEPKPDRVPVWEPYVRGERTPYHDTARRAVLHDLDLTHDAAAVRRAAYEASGFVTRQHIEMTGVEAKRIVATGGGVRVPEWVQAMADCTGLPVDVVAVPEGAALGAAFMARVAAGLEPDMAAGARWARTAGTVEPDPAWAAPVAARYQRFRELVER
jgi:xylulokinase